MGAWSEDRIEALKRTSERRTLANALWEKCYRIVKWIVIDKKEKTNSRRHDYGRGHWGRRGSKKGPRKAVSCKDEKGAACTARVCGNRWLAERP